MLKPGDTFERYTVEAPLGEGGMGCVYRAHDARLGRRVALKVISEGGVEGADSDAHVRLLREARAAAALDHPNAVAIFDVGEHEGAPYIVMELVEGQTLRGAVGDASVPVATRVAQLADVARALAGAHKRGLVHRDIKPENVMVRDDGMVKVLDFGIARRAGGSIDPHAITQTPALPTLTVDGVKLGTPVYMAPEQIRGDPLDGRADQFSWGVLAYELLAGRLPWRGSSDALAVMASVLTDPVSRAPLDQAAVPRGVQEVVLRALAKRPEERFPSMDDVVRALDAAVRGEDEGAPGEPRRARERGGATEAQHFSTSEVREVLGKAIERQAEQQGSTKLRFEDLLAVAAEVGIDEGSLREASRALRAGKEEQGGATADAARRDAWIRQQRVVFYRHAGIYLIVNAAIMVLGLALLTFTPWWVWFLPALGWGIGVAIHGLIALTASEQDWREHDEGMKWWHERQQRRHDERMAGMAGRRRERKRVDVPAPPIPPARGRVRLAPTDTGREREREAEEEAAIAERREVERRRR
jgi:eukaryotic-like serine/threonine-protein kinase